MCLLCRRTGLISTPLNRLIVLVNKNMGYIYPALTTFNAVSMLKMRTLKQWERHLEFIVTLTISIFLVYSSLSSCESKCISSGCVLHLYSPLLIINSIYDLIILVFWYKRLICMLRASIRALPCIPLSSR